MQNHPTLNQAQTLEIEKESIQIQEKAVYSDRVAAKII